MPCDRLCSGGILPSLARRFSPLLHHLLICKGRERENQWCSVKSPLLINEYFLSREEKERQIERKERETAPMGQICMHGLVAALCRSMEIYQRERERERWSRRKRGKQRVVHRQEISPGKLIPKHKSHRPPLLFPPKSGSGFIFSSFSALHTEL